MLKTIIVLIKKECVHYRQTQLFHCTLLNQKRRFFKRLFCVGDREGIRTLDPQLRRLLLYPAELPDLP